MNLRGSLGIIEQVDEKQQSMLDSLVNMLKTENKYMHEQNPQAAILKDIQNFHKYYQQKCFQYKKNYDIVNQQNWEYAAKILKYEKGMQNYQKVYLKNKQQLTKMQTKVKQLQYQYQRQKEQFSWVMQNKNKQITELKHSLDRKQTQQELPKRKLIKLKQKSIRIDHQDPSNLQSARSHRQAKNLKNQLQQYILQIHELSKENQILKKKIKHLQADRKYEQEKLKSATLSLELDLKIKNQQINRLNSQIQTYQNKFQDMIRHMRQDNSSNSNKLFLNSNFLQKNVLVSSNYENWQNISLGERITQYKQSQKTQKKLDVQSTQRTQKKIHKRHGSSNLQQNRNPLQKQDLNLKIKIFRFKNKKS